MDWIENPKFIFLDVDGVLNTLFGKFERFNGIGLIEEKLLLLKRLVNETNAEIVLTSSWRNSYKSRENLGEAFRLLNLSYRNCTPNYRGSKTRGEEISAWLSVQDQTYDIRYVILDDSPATEFAGHEDYFINIDFMTGLTEKDIEKAVGILNRY